MSKNQQINYTTKPIKLPLSTGKEYVLIDVEGYLNSHRLNVDVMKQVDLTKPFRLDSVSGGSRYGYVNDFNKASAVSCDYDKYKFFHEVIRQPQTNEFNTDSIAVTEQEEGEFNAMANNSEIPNGSEWKNGDECVYMNHKVIQQFVGHCPKREGYCYIQAPSFEINFVEMSKLSKPETQEQREDRERLEAAYDLYSDWCLHCEYSKFSFADFCETVDDKKFWLSTVDKTNYRLTK